VLDSAVVQDLHAITAESVQSLLKVTVEQVIEAVNNQAITNTEEVELHCLTLVRGVDGRRRPLGHSGGH